MAGGIAGAAETMVTQPFEVTKNRIQLGHGPSSVLANMKDTVAKAGPTGLYYGVQAQLLQVAFKSAIRFTAFEQFKNMLPPGSNFAAGTLAGLTEAIVWVAPTERLKVLRQAELSGAAKSGAGGSVFHAAVLVVRREGLRSLWLGTGPTAARQAIANGSRFFMFDGFKRLLSDVPGSAALAGGMTGVASVFFTNPVDVVKTHVQATPVSEGGKRASPLAAVRELLRSKGVGVLARGMQARILKIGIGQAVIFGTYDAVRTQLSKMK